MNNRAIEGYSCLLTSRHVRRMLPNMRRSLQIASIGVDLLHVLEPLAADFAMTDQGSR